MRAPSKRSTLDDRKCLATTAPRPSLWRRPSLAPWLAVVLLATMTFVAYLPTLRAGYVWDDDDHVPQSTLQRTPMALKWIWFKLGATPQYYPLTHTTFWIESHLWGSYPTGYHAVNILLHALNAILHWRLLVRLRLRFPWLAAAIFALHPVQVESVAWITERKNTLSLLFYLLAMIAAVRAWRIDNTPISAPMRRSDWTAYALCLLCFIAAVLSKTVTCTLPAALGLILWWKHGRLSVRDALMLLPLFGIALGAAKLTSGMEQWNVGADGPEFNFSLADRILIAGRAIWFYGGKLLYPHPLIFIYPRWKIDPHLLWQWLFPAGVVTSVAILFLARKRISRGPLVAVLFFIGTLFPALGFVNVYPMRFSFVADHFQYLASIGLIVLAAESLGSLLSRRIRTANESMSAGRDLSRRQVLGGINPALRNAFWSEPSQEFSVSRAIVVTALLTLLGVMTFHQSRAYHDAGTLWHDTLAKNPTCWLAMDNLGADADAHGNPQEALSWYDRSLATHPAQPEAHLNRGRLLARQHEWDAAQRDFDAALAIRPDSARPVHELAQMFAAKGDVGSALKEYEKALNMEPKLEPARMQYAALLRQLGRPQDAEAQYHKALEINPDSLDARTGLASLLFPVDLHAALSLMSQAVEMDPENARLCNNYGAMLMQDHRPAEAAEQFRSAIAADPKFAEAYDWLGYALEAQGRTNEAPGMYQKALELRPDFSTARDHLENLRRK